MTSFLAPLPVLSSERVAVLGAGPFARAVTRVLVDSGALPRVYARQLRKEPSIKEGFPNADLTEDLGYALEEAGTIIFAVPAGEMDALSEQVGGHAFPDQVALVASRGLLAGFLFPHDLIRKHSCLRKVGVLGGPLDIRELEAGRRLNIVLATRYSEVLARAKALTKAVAISYESTHDLLGVSLAGSIANVAAIAVGMAEGLDFGLTAKGVLQARGVFEATRLGIDAGAESTTFSGLAGLGELIPRDVDSMRRHEVFGRELALGNARPPGHIEGVLTAEVAAKRAAARSIECPLLLGVDAVLRSEIEAGPMLEAVLSTPLKA